ncbi:DMT family transporter [Roseomonas sp. NAR14]|uniref:DMT family transporter n=1 Tax=Roseomonas acroporae TaxID=2937791 RepID=A0A9X1Y8K0_9PROT|nr:DMT family transporter [Roseomonas acroporae]MCK8785466.1 DMT family transporter [Roseomonas acroporae]
MRTAPADVALGGLFVLIWASAFSSAKLLLQEWPPLWALAIRFALTSAVMLPVFLWQFSAGRAVLPSPADRLRLLAMGSVGVGGYLALSWESMARIPSGLTALLAATAPLFVAAGEVLLFGRRLPGLAWAGLALGWSGVAILGGARAVAGMHGAEASGVLFAIGGALAQATGILLYAPARGRIGPWTANLGQCLASAAMTLSLALLLEGSPPGMASTPALLSLAYTILVVGIAGYGLYFVMLRRLPPSTAAALQLTAPPLAALFGWALLGERLGWTDIMGGMVTLAGLAVLFRARRD